MTTIYRLMKSDFIKLKRTSFYWIHICVPLIGAFLFLWYFSFSLCSSTLKVQRVFRIYSISISYDNRYCNFNGGRTRINGWRI